MAAFLTDVVAQAMDISDTGSYVINADWTLAATSVTIPRLFLRDDYSNNTVRGFKGGFWRPSASNAVEYWRWAGDLNKVTGAVTVATYGTDTTQTSEAVLFSKWGITDSHWIRAANLALDDLYYETIGFLSTKPVGTAVSDADFGSTSTANYTASGTTFAKVTTALSENVFPNMVGSGSLTNAGYIYQRFASTPGEPVNVFTLSRAATGTFQNVLQDVSNTAAIGTTISHAQSAWQWTKRSETIPSGCESLEVRLGAVGVSDVVYMGAQCVLFPSQSRLILDSKWDNRFKAMKLMYVDLGGTSVSSGVTQGFAGQLKEVPSEDYSILTMRTAANPYGIQFHRDSQRHWFNYPLALYGRRSYYDTAAITAATAATSTVDVDIDLWEALTRIKLFEMGDVERNYPDWQRELAKASATFQMLALESTAEPPTKTLQYSRYGRVSN